MAVGTRRHRAAPDIWPGFVDAISALLIIMIFVLIVFALAQFFLSADLSNRNDALRRLNLEVAELAEMLSIERSANSDLRDNLSQMSVQLATSIAERDRLSNQLGELLPERDALTVMLAERTVESESFSMLLSERTVERDKLIEELTKRTNERDALTVQTAELNAMNKTVAAQNAKVKGELEDAYKIIKVDQKTMELQLRRIASIERDILTLSEVRKKLERKVADLAQTLKARDQTVAQSLAELEVRAKAIADRDKALAIRNKELGAARDRSKELTANLASEQERTLLAQGTIDKKDVRLKVLLGRSSRSEAALSKEQKISSAARRQVQALNLQLAALRNQLARLAVMLNASEAKAESQNVQIANLGKRLNAALAGKVQELARYRSEFFGRLREVLGEHKDIRVVGDRFVFQSEVLFTSGSSDLQPLGRQQIARLAKTLKEISLKIPKEINWVLRVDGHTDDNPISTPQFPSNWELSTGRAISVVKLLVEAGIPAHRLAATGFGEFQPLDTRSDEIAYRRNRRIEFKLTER